MTILDMIGNTPLMNIGNVYFKLEMFNPSGSIKDRIALEMLRPLKPGTVVLEATSGNTGVSFAMVSAALGLECKLYCPSSTSPVKKKLMRAYGASVQDCQWANDKMNFLNNLQDCLDAIKKNKRGTYLDQFSNPLNVRAQEMMVLEAHKQYNELLHNTHWNLLFHSPDAIVAGVGTGGTLMGLHNVFPKADVYMVATLGQHCIEGICDKVKTPLIPKNLKYQTILISYEHAVRSAVWLAKKHGIHCGVSSGANYIAAESIAFRYKRILTVFPDSGDRYL